MAPEKSSGQQQAPVTTRAISNRNSGLEDEHQQHLLDIDEPPSYSGRSTSTPTATNASALAQAVGLPGLNFSQYVVPKGTLSDDKTTVTTTLPGFYTDYEVLVELLQQQAAIPPKPIVRILGSHSPIEHHRTWTTKIDFDLMLNVTPLLWQQGWNYVKVLPSGPSITFGDRLEGPEPVPDRRIEDWARIFCEDTAESKSFTLERQVFNWDTEYLEGQIRNIVASTKYRGTLSVTFTIQYAKVVVMKTTTMAWIQSLVRLGKDRKYEAVQSIWPYADLAPGSNGRRCAVQTEQDWCREWTLPLRNSILAKKRGWVTTEDRIEAAMGLRIPEPRREWGAVGQ